jgi:uncharacterized protein YggE
MAISTSPGYRAAGIGVVSAALIVGAFSLGSSRGGGSAPPAEAATLTSASATGTGRITVTGTGTVTGVPNQLVLSAGVQVSSYSVTSALDQASQVVRNVTGALTQRGVAASDIQTSGLNISPNYSGSSPYPTSYGVTESLTATLNQISQAGAQIQAAVHAGGNAIQVNDVSLNLTNTGSLMATARAPKCRRSSTPGRWASRSGQSSASRRSSSRSSLSCSSVRPTPRAPSRFRSRRAPSSSRSRSRWSTRSDPAA